MTAMKSLIRMFQRPYLLEFLAICLLLVGIGTSWHASRRQGTDFAHMYHAVVSVVTGNPIYNADWQAVQFESMGLQTPKVVAYPPGTGFALLPFALAPYPLAKELWFVLSMASVVLGIGGLAQLARPGLRPGIWMLAAGVVVLSAAVRWGVTPLQASPFVFGLLAALVYALHTGRPRLVLAIAVMAVAFKFTLALPFFGLLLLHRRFKTFVVAGTLGGLLNVLGFARVGGLSAIRDYTAGMQLFEVLGSVDSPDPWDPNAVPRLDWAYLFNGLIGDLPTSRMLAMVVVALVIVWLVAEGLRVKRPVTLLTTAAFLVPLVCLTLQSVYHHHYDLILMLVPLVIFAAHADGRRLLLQPAVLFLIGPLVLVMAFLPVALAQESLVRMFGERGLGYLNMAFPLLTSLPLIWSLATLRSTVAGRAPQRDRSLNVGFATGK